MPEKNDKKPSTWTAQEIHDAFWHAAFESDIALTSTTATTLWNFFIKILSNYKV